MACAIVSGFALDCKDAVGGIKRILITELANVTAVGENASGLVTSITRSGSSKFFAYALDARAANDFSAAIQANAGTGTVAYEQTLNAQFTKLQYETQIKMSLLIQNRLSIIVETKEGAYFLLGKEYGLEVTGGSAATGKTMNEFQGYTLVLTGMEKALPNEVDSTIIAALLT